MLSVRLVECVLCMFSIFSESGWLIGIVLRVISVIMVGKFVF